MLTNKHAQPLYSICLFCFNQEQFVREAVNSALAQTYSPLEIVISDDCSSDGTFRVIEELTAQYTGPHRLVVNRNNENMGLAAHVNKVLRDLATGEWLVTAAGDDISLPTRVELTWQAVRSRPDARGAHCAVLRVDETGLPLNVVRPSDINIDTIDRESMLGAAAAYHKDVVNLFDALDANVQNEDMVLSLRALLAGSIISIDEVGVKWRRHGNNISGRVSSTTLEQIKFLYLVYERRRLFASIQQLRDVLSFEERALGLKKEIVSLEGRLLKRIESAWKITRFSSYLFEGQKTSLGIKANPKLWFILGSKYLKQSVSNSIKKRNRA